MNLIPPITSGNAASLAKDDQASLKDALANPKGTSDPKSQKNINKLLHRLIVEQSKDKDLKLDKPIQTLVDMQKMIDAARPDVPQNASITGETGVAAT